MDERTALMASCSESTTKNLQETVRIVKEYLTCTQDQRTSRMVVTGTADGACVAANRSTNLIDTDAEKRILFTASSDNL